MSDIVEAAARALQEMDIHKSITADYGYDFTARAILTAVTPLIEADAYLAVIKLKSIIEAAALERAAKVAEGYDEQWGTDDGENIAAAIRALIADH